MQALRLDLGPQPNLHSIPYSSVPTGCSITEAVTILGTKLRVYQKQFNATHLLALCDYFHNTFIRHYRLYQFVLSQDQEVNLTVAHVQMCAPPQPLPLTEGTNSDLWRHEQQLAELSTAEVQKRTNVLLLKETLLLEQAHMLQRAFGVREAPEQLQPQPTLRREVSLCLPAPGSLRHGRLGSLTGLLHRLHCNGDRGPHGHVLSPTDFAFMSLHNIFAKQKPVSPFLW